MLPYDAAAPQYCLPPQCALQLYRACALASVDSQAAMDGPGAFPSYISSSGCMYRLQTAAGHGLSRDTLPSMERGISGPSRTLSL